MEERGGKLTKPPYTITGRKAATDSPSSWSTLDRVRAAYEQGGFAGVGFVFNGDGLMRVDLDDCRDPESGEIVRWAGDILDTFRTYAEISPSETGVKILCRGRLPGERRRTGHIELYEDGRYFTVTGHRLDGAPASIEDCQVAVDRLYRRLFGAGATQEGVPRAGQGTAIAPRCEPPRPDSCAEPPADKLAALCSGDPAFLATWEHKRRDLSDESPSGYDLALASRAAAAGWTDEEVANLLVAFRRRHGLDVAKAIREDYLAHTIARARWWQVGHASTWSEIIQVRRHYRRQLLPLRMVVIGSEAR